WLRRLDRIADRVLGAAVFVTDAHRAPARRARHALAEHVPLDPSAQLIDRLSPTLRANRRSEQGAVLVRELGEADAERAEARRGGRNDQPREADPLGDLAR